jgi:DNA-binding NtrC family response regulator
MGKKKAKTRKAQEVRKPQMLSYCEHLFEHQRNRSGESPLYGLSGCVNNLVDYRIAECAASGSNVLVTGETGTGKELVVNEIKRLSHITGKFVVVNCAEFSKTLLESELFGHKEGAFTGATKNRDGLLKTCNGGALFLDELGAMKKDMQAQILRVIEHKKYRPAGSDTIETLNKGIRVFAATNDAKNVREDLKWRFQEHISIPPLRERLSDVFAVIQGLLDAAKSESGTKVKSEAQWAITADNLVKIVFSLWPGNVRELKNAVDMSIARWKFDKSKTDYILFQYDPAKESGEMFQGILASSAIRDIWKELVEKTDANMGWINQKGLRKLFSKKRLSEMTKHLDSSRALGLSRSLKVDRELFYKGKNLPAHRPFFTCAEAITFLCLTDEYLAGMLNGGPIYTKERQKRCGSISHWTDFDNDELALSLEFLNSSYRLFFPLPDGVSRDYDSQTLRRKESRTSETPDLTGYSEGGLLELYFGQMHNKYTKKTEAAKAASLSDKAIKRRYDTYKIK